MFIGWNVCSVIGKSGSASIVGLTKGAAVNYPEIPEGWLDHSDPSNPSALLSRSNACESSLASGCLN